MVTDNFGKVATLLAIPTKQQIAHLGSLIPTSATNKLGYSKGPRTLLTIGAGAVQVRVHDQAKADAARVARRDTRTREIDALVREDSAWLHEPMALTQTIEETRARLEETIPEIRGVTGVKRGRITSWSRKSKSRMQLVLGTLDYSPLFEAGHLPAMVTLTMPGQYWEECAPTPEMFRELIRIFKQRYIRAWGVTAVGVWKMEFQERGAPHLHILMTPPVGKSADSLKLAFKPWLSQTWAAVVAVADGAERAKHIRAGTGIDYPVGQRYNDPKRIAQYFAKHGAYLDKDYQNQMPQLWLDALEAGAAGARFWGYWGLEKAVSTVELNDIPPVACEVDGLLAPIALNYVKKQPWELEEVAPWATDTSVLRQWARDQRGTPASDAVIVQRHLRRLARSMAANRHRMVTTTGRDGKPLRYRPIQLEQLDIVDAASGEVHQIGGRTSMRLRDHIRYDAETGTCTIRKVIGYYQGGSGYLIVNDGRVTGFDIVRLLASRDMFALAV